VCTYFDLYYEETIKIFPKCAFGDLVQETVANCHPKHKNQGWIAGVVIAVTIVIGVVAVGAYVIRERIFKKRNNETPTMVGKTSEDEVGSLVDDTD